MTNNTPDEKVTLAHKIGYGIGDRILLLIAIGCFVSVGHITYECAVEMANQPERDNVYLWLFMIGVVCFVAMGEIVLTNLDHFWDLIMGR